MLVLLRRIGESIVIGDDVLLTILSATSTQVRVGIAAPKELRILRQEVFIKLNNQEAASRE